MMTPSDVSSHSRSRAGDGAAVDGAVGTPAALTKVAERRWAYERTQPCALHGDGQVCRCAVKLRVETLARGLDRPELWGEEPPAVAVPERLPVRHEGSAVRHASSEGNSLFR